MAKRILLIVLCVLAVVLAVSAIGFATNGFDKNTDSWGITQLNENNLFKVDSYTIKSQNSGDGYVVTVSDNGEIKVTGKNETGNEVKLLVQEITLTKGTYTFTSGASGVSKNGYSMYLSDGTTTHYADFSGNTFDIAADATFTAYIVIKENTDINATFKPVIVEGAEAGAFYVVNND